MTCCCKWSTRSFSLVLVVGSPFRTVIDSLFINDESAVFTDGFDRAGRDPAIALRTWVRAGVCLDVLVEARFVDFSSCHWLFVRCIVYTPHPSQGEINSRGQSGVRMSAGLLGEVSATRPHALPAGKIVGQPITITLRCVYGI